MNPDLLLALEFSTERASVALWQEGQILATHQDEGAAPSERIWSLLDSVLAKAQRTWEDLGGIAYGAGPGGFTGVRLACGIAQGLGLGLGIPLFPISTLECLTEVAPHPRVVVALDARMNQVYLAAYERQGEEWQERLPPQLCHPTDLPDLPAGDWWGVGSGAVAWNTLLDARWGPQWQGTVPGLFPHATHIAALAGQARKRTAGVSPAAAQPIYLRQRVALTRAERGL
ncbi:tRNA (adenosine(37)-N6)-threonylcarbamoyltransferase complex dimerization subunit type 1 TsaB [Ferrovum myxofaciens]|uniref:tRNA (Adenosine(37)-N6)-threonylcarbamoyltransferase complex dimerization subunit type 1 TsaB n=1 Tax=Ferrovum myxofaciens TaxID=416213 RepID=A0A8F3DVM4_9PROT|nr:tRNA (adenosine(37)-N6)-threonylcarbamoyltransferase complex dimerization subunit type 1 TsaB [Ferrovum myxofaciens]NDU90716.1 tRNA (adenosine(37)-N6)-threonylcarbamoyltransferase complex dimerization subunit type 1 TsaB [Ferrovum sp.]KXW58193.1 tRNA threonylcarbamoyladenosine biosynthesis protein TsaB [Ferrovum myxofaciens]QKE39261.1 MAG: tRNA (adenosine(37)-N6)-threonylcarbamoyltransferase complex dimerization subunit type 1 TsaB [Ferrovum myxofaciens]QWY74519.1 MAG: tRNA (adenosine(37)-N6